MIVYAIAFFCVIGIAAGQILFKASAAAAQYGGTFFALKPAGMLLSAMCLYGVTSIAWVWVLQQTELGRVYPLMALAFILVPLGSYIFFGERFQSQYFIGVALIMIGIFIALKA